MAEKPAEPSKDKGKWLDKVRAAGKAIRNGMSRTLGFIASSFKKLRWLIPEDGDTDKQRIAKMFAAALIVTAVMLAITFYLPVSLQEWAYRTSLAPLFAAGLFLIGKIIKGWMNKPAINGGEPSVAGPEENGNDEDPERGKGKEMKRVWTWFVVILAFVSCLITASLLVILPDSWLSKTDNAPLMSGPGFFILVLAYTLLRSWKIVPEQRRWVIEVLGEFDRVLTAGPHFLFPFFGVVHVKSRVFMGQMPPRPLPLEGSDFKDGTVKNVKADFTCQIVDVFKATYVTTNLMSTLELLITAVVRSYLSNYEMEEANRLKKDFTAARILNDEHHDKPSNKFPDSSHSKKLEDSELYKFVLENYGVRVIAIIVSDIELPEELLNARQQELTAKSNADVAELELRTATQKAEAAKVTRVKAGEGEKAYIRSVGEGHAESIDLLVQKGKLKPDQAANLVRDLKKYEKGVDMIIEGGGAAGFGASFEAGREGYRGKHPQTPPSQPTVTPTPPAKPGKK